VEICAKDSWNYLTYNWRERSKRSLEGKTCKKKSKVEKTLEQKVKVEERRKKEKRRKRVKIRTSSFVKKAD